jgi:hypothetical protein
MHTLTVEFREHETSGAHRSSAPALEPNVPLGPLRLVDGEGATVALVGRYPEAELGALRSAFRLYRGIAERTGHATVSRVGGSRTDTSTFGFAATQPLLRRMACRPCGGALVAPAPHAAICEAATYLNRELRRIYPERERDDSARARDRILPDWFLGDSYWTSGVLNFNSPIAYHYDANNLPCWSAMVVVRRGMRGGHLHLPAYDVVLPCRDGDVVFFPGYSTLHSVTPMRRVEHDAYRFTAVYYTIKRMESCGPAEDQLAISRRRRTATETGLRERQRAEGLFND